MKKVKMTKKHFLMKNNLIDSYIFIGQYHKYNTELRGVVIKALHEKYINIKEDKDINNELKIKIIAELEIEIMCKLMELTESLASICHSLTEDETKIKENFVDFNEKQGLTSKNFYKNINKGNEFYYRLLTYPNLDDTILNNKEKKVMKRIYYNNILVMKELFKVIRKFRKYNLTAYNKNRHSRPMLIGFPTNDSKYYGFSTIISRKKHSKKTKKKVTRKIINTLILHNEEIVNQHLELSRMIIQTQKDLLWNKIIYFECDGFKNLTNVNYFNLSKESKTKLNNMIEKNRVGVIRQNIKAEMKMEIKIKIFKDIINFYINGFKKVKLNTDSKLETYFKEI